MKQPLFIEFEVSGHSYRCYPIQVAWSLPDGRVTSRFINPTSVIGWEKWDAFEESDVHGISRERLSEEGLSPKSVAYALNSTLKGQTVYCSPQALDDQDRFMELFRATGSDARFKISTKASSSLIYKCGPDVFGGLDDEAKGMLLDTLKTDVCADLGLSQSRAEDRVRMLQEVYRRVLERNAEVASAGRVVFSQVPEGGDSDDKRLKDFIEFSGRSLALRGRVDAKGGEEFFGNNAPWLLSAFHAVMKHIDVAATLGSALVLPPILLVGPPDSGKSWFARQLADLLDLPIIQLPMGGMSDDKVLRGTMRGWGSACPSTLLQEIVRIKVANPIVVLEELDKAGSSRRNGNAWDTLLQMLDPGNASCWMDDYLQCECDLSAINWIATANEDYQILMPAPLLSRMRVIHVPRPRPEHRPEMLRSVIKEYQRMKGLDFDILQWLDQGEWDVLVNTITSPRHALRGLDLVVESKIRRLRTRPM